MRVLGIESSCDETGVAIYDGQYGLVAHCLYSQTDLHAKYGGVVPELASRDHIKKLLPLVKESLAKANLELTDLHGIAYTAGPGLIGALLAGASFGRSLGFALNIPTIGVHHMEAHLLAPLLEDKKPRFPFLALLVSGGHTQLVKVKNVGVYEILGESLDDAVGEAFDKTAKLLGLGYPGGSKLAQLATKGRSGKFNFPRPMIDRPGLDFSFSGLKTAAVNIIQAAPKDEQTKADIAHAFEKAVVDTLVKKVSRALKQTGLLTLVVAGGVSANLTLRQELSELMKEYAGEVFYPRLEFCTDNGAMVALAGFLRLAAGQHDGLEINVRSRWPLDDLPSI